MSPRRPVRGAGRRLVQALVALPGIILLAACIAPDDPEPIDLPAALAEAEAEGPVLVPAEVPDDAFVSWASQVEENGVTHFVMTLNRSPSGLAQWCAAPQEHADVCGEGVSSGTVDGVFWSVSGDVPAEGPLRDGEPTSEWQDLEWVRENGTHAGRG
ncbi:hypothetical protein SAMN05445756_1111 [Kytococcus aerolatus]|uniref:Lipoprotein n=1 Tax=Kytococcus aerolatus TaxID=592308 RepID=A0A212TEE7_9MICO|nr:hypothetical protein SAMN05445756_1111 [Kytococcus aerolatus]